MALRNDESISELGKRMLALMEEHGYQSPKELAKELFSRELIHVKTRDDRFNSEERKRDNAILSIEKKIVRHIRTGLISDDSGEYLPGYCKLLDCASDYLLGLTRIKSSDIEVRRICEKTGLREPVVRGFIEHNIPDSEDEAVAGWWSFILSTELLTSIPHDLVIASQEDIDGYRLKGLLLRTKWCEEHAVELGLTFDNEMSVSEIEEALEQKEPHLQGMLYKISRDLITALEKEIVETNRVKFEGYPEEMLQKYINVISEAFPHRDQQPEA